MTLRNLWGKLRKRNKEDYRQFQFSTAFAVMLISSFLMLVCSPLIQGALPEGGDSGKQVWMSFGVSAIGCIVFVLYVTKLFLRYKSREIGIFLALGAEKHILKRSLAGELARMTAVCSAAGILLGAVIAFITGNIIKVLIADVYDGDFSFTVSGLLFSVCYALILFLFIQFQAGRAMKRTNVIEVINEQRRQEPMKKSVSKAYLISGIALTLAGIFGALILPQIVAYTAGIFLGTWTNAFYLAAVFGVYRVLVYTVSSHQRGRNPQKYYNNLIDYGMMKFQGASVVRNMLVITLLLFGGLYAVSYLPTMLTGASVDPENPLKATDWQFAPQLVPLLDQQMLMALAARLLTFSYIFIICIAAVGVIGYTRSQSVGLTNRQVFEDIRRLGADRQYRRTLMRRQLRKVFVLPTILGAGVCLLYETLILWNNDGQISAGEIRSLLIITLIAAATAVYQFTIYRLSVRKTGKLLKL